MQSCKHQAQCQHAAALAYQLDRDARATALKWMQDANSKEKKKKSPQGLTAQPIHPRKYFYQTRELIYVIKKKLLACIFSFGDVTESSLILLLTSS